MTATELLIASAATGLCLVLYWHFSQSLRTFYEQWLASRSVQATPIREVAINADFLRRLIGDRDRMTQVQWDRYFASVQNGHRYVVELEGLVSEVTAVGHAFVVTVFYVRVGGAYFWNLEYQTGPRYFVTCQFHAETSGNKRVGRLALKEPVKVRGYLRDVDRGRTVPFQLEDCRLI